MRIDILTIFPTMFQPVLGESIVKRAVATGKVSIRVHDLRGWSQDKHRKVDDRPYGGGPGMVMKPEPFFDAVEDLKKEGAGSSRAKKRPHIVLMSPRGRRLDQLAAQRFSTVPWLILLCGHYEGVDERVRTGLAQEELSIGDYVLTGGELPAMVVVDSVVRLLPGCLGDCQSVQEESFCSHLLEYPQYTRPEKYRRMRVPAELLSGDQARIAQWRKLQALRKTLAERPDLFHGSPNSSD